MEKIDTAGYYYGLTSVKEIMETGASEGLAGEVMRFKLRFAFDKIRKTEELIDFRVIDKEVVELKNGVLIQYCKALAFTAHSPQG